jgi:hypothetical protein
MRAIKKVLLTTKQYYNKDYAIRIEKIPGLQGGKGAIAKCDIKKGMVMADYR